MNVTFYITEAKEMAIFISQLVREGVTFKINRVEDRFTIEFTGGF